MSFSRHHLDRLIRILLCILVFWIPYSPAVVEVCVVLALIVWIIKRSLSFKGIQSFRPIPTGADKYILFFLASSFVSSLMSPLFDKSIHGFVSKTLEWFIIFYLVAESFTESRQIRILLAVLMITSMATALDSFWQFFSGKDIFLGRVVEIQSRVSAGFKTTNALSGFLIFPVVIAFAQIIKGKNPWIWTVVFIVLSGSLILTFTRAGWMAAILSLGLFLILYKKDSKAFRFVSYAMVIALILAFIFCVYKYNNRLFSEERATSLPWRMNVWADAFEMLGERPLLGHGPNTFMQLFEYYRHRTSGDPTYAHNCFLQLAAETGLIGLGLFLLILTKLFSKAFVVVKEKKDLIVLSLLCGSVGFLFHSLFDTHLYSLQLSVLFWTMMGLLVSANQTNNQY